MRLKGARPDNFPMCTRQIGRTDGERGRAKGIPRDATTPRDQGDTSNAFRGRRAAVVLVRAHRYLLASASATAAAATVKLLMGELRARNYGCTDAEHAWSAAINGGP